MAKRENFTAGRVEKLQCEEGKQQSIHWDGKTPGLGLRVTSAGAKSYIFETRLFGKTLRITIGDLKTWPVGKAQAEATRLKGLTDQGIDPRQLSADKKAAAEVAQAKAKQRDLTVAEAWSAYVADRTPAWGARHILDHANMIQLGGEQRTRHGGRPGDKTTQGVIAPLLPLKLSELDADRVKSWLKTETARRPTQARLAYRLLRAFLNWCSDNPDFNDVTNADACSAKIAKDTLAKAGTKDDCLQKEQLPAWFGGVRAIRNPVVSAYLQSLLLTGARRGELVILKWKDVDFQWNAMTIKDKVEGDRTIPLTPYVSHLLAALPRRNEWVFSSTISDLGRIADPGSQHRVVSRAAGIEGLSLHGLRRSFGTLSEWVECPVGVVAQIMGHKPSAIAEKHYRRRPLDLLRMWHEKIEAWILEQVGVRILATQQSAALQVVK